MPVLLVLVSGCASRQIRKTSPSWKEIRKEILTMEKKKKKTPNPRALVTLSGYQYKKASSIVAPANLKIVDRGGPEGKHVVALTWRNYVEKLKKKHIIIYDESENVPYKYLVPGFLEREGKPVPCNNGRIIVNDGYHDTVMVENLLKAFAEKYPDITDLRKIGTTWQDRTVWALKISRDAEIEKDKPAFLFCAAHHASELLSTEMVLDIIEYLTVNYQTDEDVRGWVDDFEIWCVPLVNPDGNAMFMHFSSAAGRKNGRDTIDNGKLDPRDGVDLNRNYPFRWNTLGEKASSGKPVHNWYRGPEPASEPETRAMMKLADEQRFVMAISFHTVATKILVPYTIDEVKNPDPSVPWIIGKKIAELCDSCREDRDYEARRNLYSVDGTDQDWHYFQHGTVAYILEGPRHNSPYDRDRDCIVQGVRPAWMYMLSRLSEGPTLSGNVYDAESREPLEAAITIDEIRTFEGENHTSHPVSGRFDRLLPAPGTYHLNFSREGYHPKSVTVETGLEWKKMDVFLERALKPI
jgi:hypothetical protein